MPEPLGRLKNQILEIIDARNKTTHVYSEEEAKKIYEFITEKVMAVFTAAEKSLEEAGFLND